MLPRVGSLHYLCGHCGHAGHSLLVRDGIKPRSSHNILEPTADLRSREKPSRPKSLHSSFEPINVPDGRRKKKRRRTIFGAPPVSPPEHDYESLVSSPDSSCSQMQTLDVRIKVTRAVMRESGQFDNGCSVYDNIAVRDGQDSNGSWQYTERISQDCPMETSWKRSSPDIVTDTEQREENRRPRLKMFKLKCLDKVASFTKTSKRNRKGVLGQILISDLDARIQRKFQSQICMVAIARS